MSYTSASQITFFRLFPMTFLCFLGMEISWLCQPFNCAPEPLVYSLVTAPYRNNPNVYQFVNRQKKKKKKLSLTMQLDPTPP